MEDVQQNPKQPFDEIMIHGVDANYPHTRRRESGIYITVAGYDGAEKISSDEFRLLTVLVRERGNIVTHQDVTDALFGEPEEDLPLTEIDRKYISNLRMKLERLSRDRFSIDTWNRGGWYLSDLEHPELKYNGSDHHKRSGRRARESMKGNQNRRKK